MFTLISLPYAPNALEPVISANTIGFHHGKHLQTYVNNLNALLPGSPFEALCHSERSEESALAEIVRRPDHLKALQAIIDWAEIERRYTKA